MKGSESREAIEAVDDLLASVGLQHGRRQTLGGTWSGGERNRGKQAQVARKKTLTHSADAGIVRIAGWAKYSWLRHGFSTREGGGSQVYGTNELNLGWTAEDDIRTVAANRRRFVEAIAGGRRASAHEMELVGLRQIHSGMVRQVRDTAGPFATPEGKAILRGDGAITAVPGLLLGIQTADCVPVLVVDVKQRVVAAFHAGWRGTLGRIVEHGVGTLRLEYGSRVEDLVAAVGPAIGPCCYAVGEELRYDFQSQFAYSDNLFREVYDSDPVRDKYPLLFLTARAPGHSNIGPQIHLDLAEANRRQLLDAGLAAKKITVVGECTSCSGEPGARKYFSHRGENGFTGRMLSVVGIVQGKA